MDLVQKLYLEFSRICEEYANTHEALETVKGEICYTRRKFGRTLKQFDELAQYSATQRKTNYRKGPRRE